LTDARPKLSVPLRKAGRPTAPAGGDANYRSFRKNLGGFDPDKVPTAPSIYQT
jgi:hypothetical protein